MHVHHLADNQRMPVRAKLKDAFEFTLEMPLLLTVDAQPIGRGTTAPVRSR